MLKLKKLHPQYITNEAGEKTSVILPISEFEELLENIEDLAAVAERREEPTIAHEELVAELKRDGLLIGSRGSGPPPRSSEALPRTSSPGFWMCALRTKTGARSALLS
jgi:hypothetical protein